MSVSSRANQCQGTSSWPIGLGFAFYSLCFLSASQILFTSKRAVPLLKGPRQFARSCTVCLVCRKGEALGCVWQAVLLFIMLIRYLE